MWDESGEIWVDLDQQIEKCTSVKWEGRNLFKGRVRNDLFRLYGDQKSVSESAAAVLRD